MVIAPQRPNAESDARLSRRWRWIAIIAIVLLAGIGIVAGVVLLDGTSDSGVGPGPVGPVGPEEPIGPQGPVGQQATDVIVGSGVIASEARNLGSFDSVVISGEGNVVITQSDNTTLAVQSDDNLLPLITTEVRGSTLYLDKAEGVDDIDPTNGVMFMIGTPDLDELGITGAGSLVIEGLATDDLSLVLSGVGTIEVGGLEATQLTIDGSGTGSITVSGQVDFQEIAIADAVSYMAGNLGSESAHIETGSIQLSRVWVIENLDIVIESMGSVEYYGRPRVTSFVSGSGSIIPLEQP